MLQVFITSCRAKSDSSPIFVLSYCLLADPTGLTHLHIRLAKKTGVKKFPFVKDHHIAPFGRVLANYFGDVSECVEQLFIPVLFFFEFFLFSLSELPARFIQNFIEGRLLLVLRQFLNVLPPLPFFLLLPDEFCRLIEFLRIFSWPFIGELDEVVKLSFLPFGFVLCVVHHR